MRIDVLTLFPEVFGPFFEHSILGRAKNAGLVEPVCTNYRDFAHDRRRTVDDRPFGGGPGMILKCEPVFEAVEHVERRRPDRKPYKILLTPQGIPLKQALVRRLAREPWLMILCGHYEGFDDRIRAGLDVVEISIGDFVVSGGESAAMALIDAVARLLPGVVGHADATHEESFSEGFLEYPQYTRPRTFRGMSVPDVLLSGHHARIEAWRREEALDRTHRRRPDLLNMQDQ